MSWGVHSKKTLDDIFTVQAVNPERFLPSSLGTASKRAHNMSNVDLLDYADTSLSDVIRLLVENRRDPGTGDHLRDAEHSAAALWATLAELATRQPVPPPAELSAKMLRSMGTASHG